MINCRRKIDSRLSLSQLNRDSRRPEILQDFRLSALNLNQDSSLNSCFHDFSSSVEDQYSLDSSRLSGPAHFNGVSVGGPQFLSCYSDPPLFDLDYYVALHNRVYSLGQPNFLGARLSVPSPLSLSLWRSLLTGYSDEAVCDFLEFGWPIGYDYSGFLPSSDFRNHKGVLDFPSAVDSYLLTEIALGSVCGPFVCNPFSAPFPVSPLNSVPKLDTTERCFILDLSWPEGSSVNDRISKEFYLGWPVSLTYPTVDDIADRIVQLGPGCLLFKRDLKHTYRPLPVDPLDYPLLGYSWRDRLFSDVCLPMGLRSAAMACQRVTNAVCFMLSQAGCDVLSYLDDFIGISVPRTAYDHYSFSGLLLQALGLQESSHKACPPSTQVTCLGVLFDKINSTMSITPDRLREITGGFIAYLAH